MRPSKQKKKLKDNFYGLPEWEIVPTFHGMWALRYRRYVPGLRMGGFYYMEKVASYKTKAAAEKDVKHLGLK